jgi:hypothetical protein
MLNLRGAWSCMKGTLLSEIQSPNFEYICEAHRNMRGWASSFLPTVAVSVYSPTMFSEWQSLDPHSSTATWIASCLSMRLFASRRRNLHLQYRRFTVYVSLFSDEPRLEKSVAKNPYLHRLLALFSVHNTLLLSCHFFFKTTCVWYVIYWLNIRSKAIIWRHVLKGVFSIYIQITL